MGTSTKSGSGLLPLLLIGGLVAVAVFGGSKVVNSVEELFGGGGGTEIVGAGDNQGLIASSADSGVKQCAVAQMLADHQCGDLSVLVVDAARMPFIARNTKLAWEKGKPGILTMNRSKQIANRMAACPRSFPPALWWAV